MEEGEGPSSDKGDPHRETPTGAPEEETPGSAKDRLRHQDRSGEDSLATAAQHDDGVLPGHDSGSPRKSPASEGSVGNGAVESKKGKARQEAKQGRELRSSKKSRKKSDSTKNGQMTDVRRSSQDENTHNQGNEKSDSVDGGSKAIATKHDSAELTSSEICEDAMTDSSASEEQKNKETNPATPKHKATSSSALQAALSKNVKMGRDDTGSMMSELLMRMARDHEEKHSRKEVERDTPGPSASPASMTSNVGSPASSSEETGSRMLLTLLQQQPDLRRGKPQSRGKASPAPASEDDGKHPSPHQWTPATGSPTSATAGDNDLTSVISNVNQSGSFLMQLLTTNQQFASAREVKTQEHHPMLAITSTKSLRGTEAGHAFSDDRPTSPEQEEGDGSSVLVIQPEPSAEPDNDDFKCPICGARFDNGEDRAFHFQVDHRDLELVDEDSSQQEYIALEELKALAATKPSTRTRKRKASHTRRVVENVDMMEEGENFESPIAKRTSSQDSFRPEQLQVASPKLIEEDEDIGFVQGYLCKTCGMLRKSLEELREHKAAAHPELDNTAKRKSPEVDVAPKKTSSTAAETKSRSKFALETCLICGKSSRDVTLKNIYRTADRYDMTLTRLLDRTVQESIGHSRFICVVCKRQVRKLEMAIKIKRQLQDMFDKTNSSASNKEREPEDKATSDGRRRRKSAAAETEKRRMSQRSSSPEREGSPLKLPVAEPCSSRQDQYPQLPQDVASVFNGLMSDNPPILEEIAPRMSPGSYTSTNMALRSLLAGRVLNSASSSPVPSSFVPTILKVPELHNKREGFPPLSIKAEPVDDIPLLNSSTPFDDDDETAAAAGTGTEEDEEDNMDHTFIPPKGTGTPKSATAERRRSKRTPKRVESPTYRKRMEGGDPERPDSSSPCPQPQRSILGEILGLGTSPIPSQSGYTGSTSTRSQAQGSEKDNSGSALSSFIKSEPDSGLSESRVSSLISQAINRVTTASNIRPSVRNPGYALVPSENPNISSYQCVICHMIFFTQEGITAHVSCHVAGSPDFKCFKCGFFNHKLPSQWRIMQGHLLTHRMQPYIFNKYPCTILGCKQLFRSENERVDHIAVAHQGQTSTALLPTSSSALIQQGLTTSRGHGLSPNGLFDYTCPLCNNSLQTIEALDVHVKCHGSSGNFTSRSYQCYLCGYCHPTQPGSWRFMRGHLTKFHVPDPIPNEWFLYYECSRYTCRIKFSSLAARELHEACHDNSQDGHFRCHWCGYKPYDTPFLWDPMKSHIIKYHPMVFSAFNLECLCGVVFHGYDDFSKHLEDHRY